MAGDGVDGGGFVGANRQAGPGGDAAEFGAAGVDDDVNAETGFLRFGGDTQQFGFGIHADADFGHAGHHPERFLGRDLGVIVTGEFQETLDEEHAAGVGTLGHHFAAADVEVGPHDDDLF